MHNFIKIESHLQFRGAINTISLFQITIFATCCAQPFDLVPLVSLERLRDLVEIFAGSFQYNIVCSARYEVTYNSMLPRVFRQYHKRTKMYHPHITCCVCYTTVAPSRPSSSCAQRRNRSCHSRPRHARQTHRNSVCLLHTSSTRAPAQQTYPHRASPHHPCVALCSQPMRELRQINALWLGWWNIESFVCLFGRQFPVRVFFLTCVLSSFFEASAGEFNGSRGTSKWFKAKSLNGGTTSKYIKSENRHTESCSRAALCSRGNIVRRLRMHEYVPNGCAEWVIYSVRICIRTNAPKQKPLADTLSADADALCERNFKFRAPLCPYFLS